MQEQTTHKCRGYGRERGQSLLMRLRSGLTDGVHESDRGLDTAALDVN